MNTEEEIKKKEVEAMYFLRHFPRSKTAVSFSGGKDSLVALHLASRVGIRRAVFSDTTIESPKTIEYIKEVGTMLGVKIDIVRPQKSFWELLPILGPPSTRHRWCCPTIKYPQLNEYAKKYNIKYYITGLRRNESLIRMEYKKIGKNPMTPYVIQVNPIIDWTENEVWEYIKKYNLPIHPNYKLGLTRSGCVICPYKSPKELRKLKEIEPEIWEKFEEFLITYADTIGIPNKEEFLNGGWRSWRPPTKRKIVGEVEISNSKVSFNNGLSKESFKLLGILSNGTDLQDKNKVNKVKIVIEKELNCIGCGACISLCPTNALFINKEGRIDVNLFNCIYCYVCLDTSKLRGACIGRTYTLETFVVRVKNTKEKVQIS